MKPSSDESLPRLTSREISGIVIVCVFLFLVVAGPVWKHPWQPDASILWSYLPIPFLVAAALKSRGKLRLAAVLADSLLAALFKFGITASILIALWTFGPPPLLPTAATKAAVGQREPESREISSSVNTEGDRTPRAATYDCAGAVSLQIGAGRIAPAVLHLRRSFPVCISSSDGRLHAIELVDAGGAPLANVPVLASGSPHLLSFEEISRASSLRCTVHRGEEAKVELAGRSETN